MQPGMHPYLGGLPSRILAVEAAPSHRAWTHPPGASWSRHSHSSFLGLSFLWETSLLLWTIRRIPLFQHLPYVFRHTCVKQGKSAFQAEYLVYWQSKDHSVGLGGETAGFSNSGHHLPFFLPGDYHHDKVPLLLSGDAEALPHPF